MDRWSVYFSVPEVDTIGAEKGRTGSNLLPQLRKAWDGSGLTFGYADRTKSIVVNEHAYRLAMVVGVQPGPGGSAAERRGRRHPAAVPSGYPSRRRVRRWRTSKRRSRSTSEVSPKAGHRHRWTSPHGWRPPDEGQVVVREVLFGFPDAARELIRTNRKHKLRLEGH